MSYHRPRKKDGTKSAEFEMLCSRRPRDATENKAVPPPLASQPHQLSRVLVPSFVRTVITTFLSTHAHLQMRHRVRRRRLAAALARELVDSLLQRIQPVLYTFHHQPHLALDAVDRLARDAVVDDVDHAADRLAAVAQGGRAEARAPGPTKSGRGPSETVGRVNGRLLLTEFS